MKICVYGGQFGSEGKGSAGEYWATKMDSSSGLTVMGENGPNSGHTNSKGKTRQIPASSFYANMVIMGPDSSINFDVLFKDLAEIEKVTGAYPDILIHENACLVTNSSINSERESTLMERIGSTVTGGGHARSNKYASRTADAIVKSFTGDLPPDVFIVRGDDYLDMIQDEQIMENVIFECSQGVMLDTNFGYYPYVTSRTTLPRAAIQRNGLGSHEWEYAGVYRTYPIRTGGNTGPTGGKEIKFEDIGQEVEIASVTKRNRRIFEFSSKDFMTSIALSRPNYIMFTHLDYLGIEADDHVLFESWLRDNGVILNLPSCNLLLSSENGKFNEMKSLSNILI